MDQRGSLKENKNIEMDENENKHTKINAVQLKQYLKGNL